MKRGQVSIKEASVIRVVVALLPLGLFLLVALQTVAWSSLTFNLYMSGQVTVLASPEIHNTTENYGVSVYRGESYFTPATLKGRLAASDPSEGDITSSITATECKKDGAAVVCPTAWSQWGYGDYTISYRAYNSRGAASPPLTLTVEVWDFTKFVGGMDHHLGLTTKGVVYSWGRNNNYQLCQNNTTTLRVPTKIVFGQTFSDIAASYYATLLLGSNGVIYSCGEDTYGVGGNGNTTGDIRVPTSVVMPAGVSFKQVTAGYYNGMALSTDGDVYGWGGGDYRATALGTDADRYAPTKSQFFNKNMVSINVGNATGAGVDVDGYMWTWGACGTYGNCVSQTGTNYDPIKYTGFSAEVKQAAAGYYGMAAIVGDERQLYTWGAGASSAHCRATSGTNYRNALPVSGATGVLDVRQKNGYMVFVRDNGYAYGCGSNGNGNLGTGNTTTQNTPAQAINIVDNYLIDASWTSAGALNGTARWGYGDDNYGQIGDGGSTNRSTPTKWSLGSTLATTTKVEL